MKVFKNADFISCEDQNRNFSILVTHKGKIVYTGDRLPDQFSDAAQIDMEGRCVVPAFGDTHLHFESFAFVNAKIDCRNVLDFDALEKQIHLYIDGHPREKYIFAFGCSAHTVREKRLPYRQDLDRITERPLLIVKYDGHAAVANSALIDTLPAKVRDRDVFEKETGWFFQEAFYSVVDHISKKVSVPQLFRNLIGAGHKLAQQGIGFVHTADGVGFPMDIDLDVMRLAARGLPQLYRIFFQTMDINKVLRRNLPRIGGCFKTALDGCFGSEDAALKAPYSNNPENRGFMPYTQEEVNRFVLEAHRQGLQIALHAIGDAAIEQALTAFEAALKVHPRKDHRHIIIHADLMDTDMIQKAGAMDIHFAVQTPFLDWTQEPMDYLERILGKRIDQLIPLKSMLDAGLVVGNGSDAPCTLPDPIGGIHAACNHPNPDERISILNALKMHTAWAARLSFDENERGTLSPGKAADFAVLDRNILETDTTAIKEIKVEALYLGGEKYTEPSRSAARLLLKCL